jgi:hypothetical protein
MKRPCLSCRFVAWTIGLAVAYGCLTTTTGQVQRQKTIAAETFALVDSKGELRSILTVTENGPQLGFIRPGSDTPYLTIGENSAVGYGIVLTSKSGATLTLAALPDGTLGIQINRQGHTTVAMHSPTDGRATGYALIDRNGRVQIPVMKDAQ